MRHYAWLCALLLIGLGMACAPIQAVITPTAPPPIASPTAAPAPVIPTPGPVTFATADGTTLTGTLYGAGSTALILSNMGDNDPAAWEREAPLFAKEGYMVLTYSFRYPARTARFTATMAKQTVDDLQAAVAFVRAQGAKTIVLLGASLGGMATAKVAASIQPAAMVVISAPADLLEFDFQVSAAELVAITMPKLLIASEDDTIVPSAATQQMFDLAAEPKEMVVYPGSAHGVQLFATNAAAELRQRLLTFVKTNAPVSE